MEVVSWKPRVFMFRDFVSDEEAAHLIRLAQPDLTRSTVADDVTGELMEDPIRTSSSVFLNRTQDAVVAAIEERIAAASRIPVENQEPFEVLQYKLGEKNEDHYDFFHDNANTQNGGQRAATVLLYLSDVEEGGETAFYTKNITWTKETCASDADVLVRPKKGAAVMFYNLKPNGEPDEGSKHSGCPVKRGLKWSATKWIRTGPHDPEAPAPEVVEVIEYVYTPVPVYVPVYVPVPAGGAAGGGNGTEAGPGASTAAGGAVGVNGAQQQQQQQQQQLQLQEVTKRSELPKPAQRERAAEEPLAAGSSTGGGKRSSTGGGKGSSTGGGGGNRTGGDRGSSGGSKGAKAASQPHPVLLTKYNHRRNRREEQEEALR